MTAHSQARIDAALHEALADALRALDPHYGTMMGNMRISRAVSLLRHGPEPEVPKLRSRAEVDAEIAKHVRACARQDGKLVDSGLLGVARDLCRLIREPTDPETALEGVTSIQSQVRSDLGERERLGKERYGVALYPHNGRNSLQDAYEEALDMACYLKQALVEKQ